MTPDQQLESLLRESPERARDREQGAFDAKAGGRRQIVIFGAGRLGRALRKGLSGTDLIAVAYSDNNPEMWGTVVDELPVLSRQQAARRFSETAVFVVAIWHPSNKPLMFMLLEQLRTLGCEAVPFPLLFWRHSQIFLPYFFWELPSRLLEQRTEIQSAFDLLADEVSRQSFAGQVQLRLLADFECIGTPFHGEQYFPGLFSLTADESFVDCGAYNGDTIRAFLEQTLNRYKKIIAFEADPAVVRALQASLQGNRAKNVLRTAVVGAQSGVVRFAGNGLGGGHVSNTEGVEVASVSLDDALREEKVSFIKMDIEGAELEALDGARQTVHRDEPVLAICSYHRPDHLWSVPAKLNNLLPDSALFIRSHCADGLDTVCYSIPRERQLSDLDRAVLSHKKVRAHSQGSPE